MLRKLQQEVEEECLWLNADEADVLEMLSGANTSTSLLQVVGKSTRLIIIDEAQQVPKIGLKLKLLYDTFPNIRIIVTGSSAFDLQDTMNEPLTGRKLTYNLYPISMEELTNYTSLLEAKRQLIARLIYGSYPDVINHIGEEKPILLELSNSYLYKDILKVEGIRKPSHIEKLLRALAFQVGSEVNFSELSNMIGNISVATIERYISMLEKAYIIFKLPAFNRNMRNEIKKGKKYYFYDNGVRNALINNFAPMDMRFDKGALWENYLISERMKYNHYNGHYVNTFFWRTKDQAEIDYIEEVDGYMHCFEFKWKSKKKKNIPKSFNQAYPQNTYTIISENNYLDFIL